MENAVKTLLDRTSKDRINDGLDILVLNFMVAKDSSKDEIRSVHDSVWAIKEFLKSI